MTAPPSSPYAPAIPKDGSASGGALVSVTHFGGAREIGATSYVVEVFGVRVLVDMGIRSRNAPGDTWTGNVLPDWTNLGRVDFGLLTHAQADHQGALPVLVREQSEIDVFCTPETRDFTDLMLRDTVKIFGRTAKSSPGFRGLFNEAEVDAALDRLCDVPFDEEVVLHRRGVEIRVQPISSGYLLGAASFHVRFVHPTQGEIRLSLNGDMSTGILMTIPGFDLARHAAFRPHLMVTEGTYGMEVQTPIEEVRARLRQRIARTIRGGGKVLIPASATGPAQEIAALMYDWNKNWVTWCEQQRHDYRELPAKDSSLWDVCDEINALPWIPTYIEGLARNVTDLYEAHVDRLTQALQERYAETGNVLWSDRYNIRMLQAGEKDALIEQDRPFVLIAPSGRVTGGRIISYIVRYASDPRVLIVFIGNADFEATGAILQAFAVTDPSTRPSWRYPLPDGTRGEVQILCQVDEFRLSGHASGAALVELYLAANPRVLVLAHGSVRALEDVRNELNRRTNRTMVLRVPRAGDLEKLWVKPDQPTGSTLRLQEAEPTVAARFTYGVTPDTVYRLTHGDARVPLMARDIALRVFGPQRTREDRRRAYALVEEVIEAYRTDWFDERKEFSRLAYRPIWPHRIPTWPDALPLEYTDVWENLTLDRVEAGYAIVRYLRRYPRLALVGPPTPSGERQAIVAMTSIHQIADRDILASVEPMSAPRWWEDPVEWDAPLRRAMTEIQIDAQHVLDTEGSQIHASHAQQARREAHFRVEMHRNAPTPLSLDATLLVTFLAKAMSYIKNPPHIIQITARELRELMGFNAAAANWNLDVIAVVSVINEVRACLGMSTLPSYALAPEYPFDVRRIWQAVVATPGVPDAIEAPLTFTDRVAVLLHDATVLSYASPRFGVPRPAPVNEAAQRA